MKCLIITLACGLMTQVMAHRYAGEPGFGMEQGRGEQFSNQGYGSENRGFGNEAHNSGGFSRGHDRGYSNDDVTKITHEHHSSGHDIGGESGFQEGGHRAGGYDQRQGGYSNHGQDYNRGYV